MCCSVYLKTFLFHDKESQTQTSTILKLSLMLFHKHGSAVTNQYSLAQSHFLCAPEIFKKLKWMDDQRALFDFTTEI